MFAKRTDLALEAQEIWQEAARAGEKLAGVRCRRTKREGYGVTALEVQTDAAAQALGKPVGRYATVDLERFWQRREDFFPRAVRAVGTELKAMLPNGDGPVLVVGLGNRAMTPDAVGPQTLEHLLITRHLIATMPAQFSGFRPVAALATGVLGTTGVESAEAVAAVSRKIRPVCVIAVDALAARRQTRVCGTIQLSDSGISPGSGVGNHRQALSRETLGVPVIALGTPTVVDAATLAADLMSEAGLSLPDEAQLREMSGQLTVTPRDVDAKVRDLSKLIGYAINYALQDLEPEDIAALVS